MNVQNKGRRAWRAAWLPLALSGLMLAACVQEKPKLEGASTSQSPEALLQPTLKVGDHNIDGRTIARLYHGQIVKLPKIQAELERIRDTLVAEIKGPPFRAQIVLVDSARMGPFVTSDGIIILPTNALLRVTGENQVAALLALELAHIALGHQEDVNEKTLLALMNTMHNGSRKLLDFADTMGATKTEKGKRAEDTFEKIDRILDVVNLLDDTILSPYELRRKEEEADRFAVRHLMEVGYGSTGLAEFIDAQAAIQKELDDGYRQSSLLMNTFLSKLEVELKKEGRDIQMDIQRGRNPKDITISDFRDTLPKGVGMTMARVLANPMRVSHAQAHERKDIIDKEVEKLLTTDLSMRLSNKPDVFTKDWKTRWDKLLQQADLVRYQERITQAEGALLEKDHDQATKIVLDLIRERHADKERVWTILTMARLRQGRINDAIENIGIIGKRIGPDSTLAPHLAITNFSRTQAKPNRAVLQAGTKLLIESFPDNPLIYPHLIDYANLSGDTRLTERLLNECQTKGSFQLKNSCLALGDWRTSPGY